MIILKNLLVIFGGRSSEYEVSLRSGASVIRNVPKDKYNVITLGITKDGEWRLYTGGVDDIESGGWNNGGTLPAVLSANPSDGALLVLRDGAVEKIPIDVIFPVLHGKNGEDGTIQGLLELSGIPYVGCGVLSSAMCMDKAITNTLCDGAGILQAKWLLVRKHDFDKGLTDIDEIIKTLSLPVFVKPANFGSSVGISKASSGEALTDALKTAFAYDTKVVLESAVKGRELECAVMGNEDPVAACVGEVVPCNEFYDYDAKYINDTSELIIPAKLSAEKTEEIRALAMKAYKILDCAGLSRVDFFMTPDGDVYLNEINTIPGFTSISMYAKLFGAAGVSYGELVDKLIGYAFERKGLTQ